MEKIVYSNKILFSILIANFNNEQYVETAIKSVISQSYPDWELIIVDNQSTYNSIEKITPFLLDNRIKLANIDLVEKILRLLNKLDSLIKFVKDRPGHDLRYAMNHNKITKELNWTPDIKLDEGLKLTVKWYINNEEWLKNVITKEYLKFYEKQYKFR